MKRFIYTICLAFIFGACENWLDVSPKTNIQEKISSTESRDSRKLLPVFI